VMVRLSLGWLLSGFVVGGVMLVDRVAPGAWRAWFAPGHGHMLFVGWFLQFVLGIAFWLLPRKRSPDRPLGYNERLSWLAVSALNIGLMSRIFSEPFERVGKGNTVTITALFVSAVLQGLAALVFVMQLWPRVSVRQVRPRPQNAGQGAAAERRIRPNGKKVSDRGQPD